MTIVQAGQIITSPNGNEYEIIRYLGEGVTAEVYEATQLNKDHEPAAVKILRADLPSNIVQNFRDEASTLGLLVHAQLGSDELLTPKILEEALDKDAEFRFLAMEYITGQSVDALLKAGPIDETLALAISERVLYLLFLLHTELRKSYTDLQLRNIWWQAENDQVKVMDFNHLSRQAKEGEMPPGAPDDLVRLGAYNYQMLTTKGALQTGETGQSLTARGGEAWQELSKGTQYLVRKALHPNPEERFQTAEDFREAVEEHLERFSEDIEDLELDALGVVNALRQEKTSEGQFSSETLREAEILVDMLERRRPDDPQVRKLKREIVELTENVSAEWGSGQQYYEVGAFTEALKRWEEEAVAWGRIDLWRWVLLARIGETIKDAQYERVRDDLEAGVAFMEEGRWRQAADAFGRAKVQGVNHPSISELEKEIQTQRHVREAQLAEDKRNWQLAADQYRAALQSMQGISYLDLLIEEFGWQDLEKRALASEVRQQESRENILLVESLQKQLEEDFDAGLDAIRNAFDEQPDNLALVNLCYAESERKQDESKALALLYQPLTFGVVTPEWRTRLVTRIDELEKELARKTEECEQEELAQAAEAALNARDWRALQYALLNLKDTHPFVEPLSNDFGAAISRRDLVTAEYVYQAINLISTEGSEDRKARIEETKQGIEKDRKTWLSSLPVIIAEFARAGNKEAIDQNLTLARENFAGDAEALAKINQVAYATSKVRRLDYFIAEAEDALEASDFERAIEACTNGQAIIPEIVDDESASSSFIQVAQSRSADIEKLKGEAERGLAEEEEKAIAAVAFQINTADQLQKENQFTKAESALAQAEIALDSIGFDDQRTQNLAARIEDLRSEFDQKKEAFSAGPGIGYGQSFEFRRRVKENKRLRLILGVLAVLLVLAIAGSAFLGQGYRSSNAQNESLAGTATSSSAEMAMRITEVHGQVLALVSTVESGPGTPIPTESVTAMPTVEPRPTDVPSPTPPPLDVPFWASLSETDNLVALPDMSLIAPDDWIFDFSDEGYLQVTNAGLTWNPQLVARDQATNARTITNAIVRDAVTIKQTNNILVSLEEYYLPPGDYDLSLELESADGSVKPAQNFPSPITVKIFPRFDADIQLTSSESATPPDMILSAPEGWLFDSSGDNLVAKEFGVDGGSISHGLSLLVTGVISETNEPISQTLAIPNTSISPIEEIEVEGSEEGVQPTELRELIIEPSKIDILLQFEPGYYDYQFQLGQGDQVEELTNPNQFTIIKQSYPTITIAASHQCRSKPEWDVNLILERDNLDEPLLVFLIAKSGYIHEDKPRDFLNILLPDGTDCWLPDYETEEWYNDRAKLVEALGLVESVEE